jgi:hypothetical protein
VRMLGVGLSGCITSIFITSVINCIKRHGLFFSDLFISFLSPAEYNGIRRHVIRYKSYNLMQYLIMDSYDI